MRRRARDRTDTAWVEALRRVDVLWLVRIDGQWRHHEEDGRVWLLVAPEEEGLAFYGEPVGVPATEALLRQFDRADGVLLDPRGPHPTTLLAPEVYQVVGVPGVAPPTEPVEVDNHLEAEAYLDALGWPEKGRRHQNLPPDQDATDVFEHPDRAPVRFRVANHGLGVSLQFEASKVLDRVAMVVLADRQRLLADLLAAEPELSGEGLIELVWRRGRACALFDWSLRAPGETSTPWSRWIADEMPNRFSEDGRWTHRGRIQAQYEDAKRRLLAASAAADPSVRRQQTCRAALLFPGDVSAPVDTTVADVVAIAAGTESATVAKATLSRLGSFLTAGEVEGEVAERLLEVALRHLRSEDVGVVDSAIHVLDGLSRLDPPVRSPKLAELHAELHHVYPRSCIRGWLFEASLYDVAPALAPALENVTLDALAGDDPREILDALERGARTPRVLEGAVRHLRHPHAKIRIAACMLLGGGGHRPAMGAIARLLDDEAAPVEPSPAWTWFGRFLTPGPAQSSVRRHALMALALLRDEAPRRWTDDDDANLAAAVAAARRWVAEVAKDDPAGGAPRRR